MTYRIRTYRNEDLPRLHEIRIAAFAPVFAGFREALGPEMGEQVISPEETGQSAHLDEIASAVSDHNMFVAVTDDFPIGFCAHTIDAETGIGEIGLNAVDPAYQGKGIGTLLYDHALDQLRLAGMTVASVGTGGDAAHLPARAAYSKVGFNAAIPSVYLYRKL